MEPTYRIAQRLHERRAAVGLPKYGRHLDADSQGCMLVHALEESADKTNYLLAEIQRRRELMKWLKIISDEGEKWSDWAHGWFVDLGGESALAQYDEILGGGTVAENATVDPRNEALRVAGKALTEASETFQVYAQHHLNKGDVVKHAKNDALAKYMNTALAAIRAAGGAR